MKISIVAAVAKNGAIGLCCRLPWHLPSDLAYFKRLTANKTIIMGRKTYESIGHPLPNRKNIIISSNPDYPAKDCQVFTSLQDAIDYLDDEEVMIIGGGTLYAQALPLTTTLYLTLIDTVCEGDTFFPKIDEKEWDEISREKHLADDKNPYNYEFVVLKRLKDK